MQWLVTLILNWLWGKLAAWGIAEVRALEKRKEDEKGAETSVTPLKDAKTAKEIDDAARDALSGL
jgi:hypothetical protein